MFKTIFFYIYKNDNKTGLAGCTKNTLTSYLQWEKPHNSCPYIEKKVHHILEKQIAEISSTTREHGNKHHFLR